MSRADMSEVRLEARALSVVLGGATVVDAVDLEVGAGEVLCLLGPNGAGKSTLLAALSGDVSPASGSVVLDGRPLDDWRHGDLARQRATLTQDQLVAFPFTVEQVVAMGRHPWRGRPEEDDDETAIESAMKTTDVARLAARVYPSLSGGERARASLARVLAQRTGVLMLDEPTAALDLLHQEAALQTARELADDGVAVVVVLHDLSLAGAYADRLCLLQGGRVVALGTPAEVLRREVLEPVYGLRLDVHPHPVTGDPMVVPARAERSRTRTRPEGGQS